MEELTPDQLSEILADVRHDAILIDHHAMRLFPKSPEDRLEFRRRIRTMLNDENQPATQ